VVALLHNPRCVRSPRWLPRSRGRGRVVAAQPRINLLPIEIKVSSANSPTGSAPKYTVTPETPKQGNADNLFSVWPGEDFTVKVKLPDSLQLPSGLIKWNVPGESIAENSKEHTFNWSSAGTKKIEVKVAETKFYIWVDVPDVGSIDQNQAAQQMPLIAPSMFVYATNATTYTNTLPATPRRDAIRHSYWASQCVSDPAITVADTLVLLTAHEFKNKWQDIQQAFNSSMDLWNNSVGTGVEHWMIGGPNLSLILQDLNILYNNGSMRIWKVPSGALTQEEKHSEGVLINSNGSKIIP
jgi:hypothetical protein